MEEDIGRKFDKTNQVLEELVSIQKDPRKRQKKFLMIAMVVLVIYIAIVALSFYL